jgi:hypothetical protein
MPAEEGRITSSRGAGGDRITPAPEDPFSFIEFRFFSEALHIQLRFATYETFRAGEKTGGTMFA